MTGRVTGVGLAVAALALPTLLGVMGSAAAQERPTTPPPAGPLRPAPFPPFQEAVLSNGLRILVVENHRQPIVSLSLSFPAGEVHDPAAKEGLAGMVASLLTKGAGTRTAEQVAEAIEGAGGSLGAAATPDFLIMSTTVLTPSLPLAFELVADAVIRPTLPESEIGLLRTQTLSGLQLELSQPSSIARRASLKALYGAHPYGRGATPASVRAITRADLVAFHRARIRPGGSLMVVAGDVTLAEVRRFATRVFGGWSGAPAATAAVPVPPARERTEILLVHRPGSVQSNLVVGNLTYQPTDPRHYAATVANRVLGGGADSRLFLILREQKSWTYSPFSGLSRRRGLGTFTASAEVRTEVTDSALTELLAQLRRIRDEAIPSAELEAAKGALVGSHPLSIETADQVAGAVANARLLGLPNDYVQTYRVRLGAVTAADAQAAARGVIRPDAAVIVVVGDGQKIYEKIKDLAPTTIQDPEGKPVSVDDLVPKPTALDLDLSRLVARRDSFAILLQGNSLGWLRGVLERTPQGYRYTEDTRLAGLVQQTTILEMDPQSATQTIKQTGSVQGQPVSIDVTFTGGRARGTARSPDPQTGQVRSVTIDTAIVAGTLDDNAIQALLPAFRWAPDARWRLNVLSASQGELRVVTLAVTGTEPVAIGTEQVEAYRAELSGGAQGFTFWVSTTAPHRLLKIGIAGAPVEFVRAP